MTAMINLLRSKRWIILRWSLLLLFLASVGLAVIPISKLGIDNRFEIWFYDQDPAIKSYDEGHAQFGNWNWMSIYIKPKEGIYSEPFLASLAGITDQLKALPDVRKVISIANARGNRLSNDELSYRSILGRAPWSSEDLAQLKQTLEANLIYRDGLVKPGDDKSTLILMQVANRDTDKDAYRVQLVNAVDAILHNQADTIAESAIVGSPFLNAELNRSSRHDMVVFYPLVSLLVSIVSWLIFRNLRDVTVVLLALTGASAWSVGLMMTTFDLNMVTIMMPTVLVTVSVANVMHFIVSFHAQRRQHPDWSPARCAKMTVRDLWVPALGTTATTAFGFLSLTQTGILPVTLLGYYAAFGIACAYLITIVLVPLLLTVVWGDLAGKSSARLDRGSNALINATGWSKIYDKTSLKHPYLVFVLFAMASAAILAGLPRLDADTDYVNLFHEKSPVKQYYHQVEAAGYATNSFTLLIHAPQGLEEESVFRAVMALEDKITALPGVRNITSPVKLIAEVDRAMALDKSAWHPDFAGYGREAMAQLILTAEISGNDDLSDLLSRDHRYFQLAIFTDYMSSREVARFTAEVESLAGKTLPKGVGASMTGLPVLWADMAAQLLTSQSSILLSLVLPLFVIMLAVIRSVPLVIIGLIVNLLPVGLILGLMAWLDIKIDMATVLIGGITMGIAVDDTIHFLWQFRRERLHGLTFMDAVKLTFDHTGTAILMTSFLLSSGFLVMVASDFYPTANFGWLTSLTVLIALAAEIFLMPTLLYFYDRYGLRFSWSYRPLSGRGRKAVVSPESGRAE
jgi:predicted RND superfamily exporter protein